MPPFRPRSKQHFPIELGVDERAVLCRLISPFHPDCDLLSDRELAQTVRRLVGSAHPENALRDYIISETERTNANGQLESVCLLHSEPLLSFEGVGPTATKALANAAITFTYSTPVFA